MRNRIINSILLPFRKIETLLKLPTSRCSETLLWHRCVLRKVYSRNRFLLKVVNHGGCTKLEVNYQCCSKGSGTIISLHFEFCLWILPTYAIHPNFLQCMELKAWLFIALDEHRFYLVKGIVVSNITNEWDYNFQCLLLLIDSKS